MPNDANAWKAECVMIQHRHRLNFAQALIYMPAGAASLEDQPAICLSTGQ